MLVAAGRGGALREGPRGSGWFAHRDEGGEVSHVEIRGPTFKGSLKGGRKTLFRLSGCEVHGRQTAGDVVQPEDRAAGNAEVAPPTRFRRLVVTEAPIDALSVAAIEGIRNDTTYVATGGVHGGDKPGQWSVGVALMRAE